MVLLSIIHAVSTENTSVLEYQIALEGGGEHAHKDLTSFEGLKYVEGILSRRLKILR